MTESIFKVNDKVIVQFPGKTESYYGTITHICEEYTPLLTVQIKTRNLGSLSEPYEKEFRISETQPKMIWKTGLEI